MALVTDEVDRDTKAFLEYIRNLPAGESADTDDLADVCESGPDALFWIAMHHVEQGEPLCIGLRKHPWESFGLGDTFTYRLARDDTDRQAAQTELLKEMAAFVEQLDAYGDALRQTVTDPGP